MGPWPSRNRWDWTGDLRQPVHTEQSRTYLLSSYDSAFDSACCRWPWANRYGSVSVMARQLPCQGFVVRTLNPIGYRHRLLIVLSLE